ncbi:MAG: isoaspartyl peptidase/L-asparaginase, partial [Proteobacteria bacterium]|nr:isoaspartyl peptidase/L-asparaginase [Pseudomonadota bacterium]
GEGADAFAELRGLDMVPPEYFYTEARYRAMQRLKQQGLDETALSEDTALEHTLGPPAEPDKLGTVGAAALDRAGNLAAGTSTGGTTNKRFGRVGDSPLLGAGNYANNRSCAVSCTGEGEFFMRLLAAYDVSALMEYRGLGLEQAAREVVMQKVTRLGGRGGLVAIDRAGRVAMPFNTPGMYRGHIDAAGRRLVAVYEQ